MTTITLHNYLKQIKELAENHQADEAIAHGRHILQQYPRHVDTYRTLAEVLLDQEDFQGAADLLQRVLSAIPDDFVAHVGLSIVLKEDGIFPQAIWHLEQALEHKPYNEALQEELRDLHARSGASVPNFIAPTQGGLARLYLASEMYPAAIQAFRQALALDENNMGLKVALTEALWLNNERVEAVALCLEILEELPNCIKANAILSEIWLHTGRIAEAQPYLHRLQALTQHDKAHCDGETAVCRAFQLKGAPPIPEHVTIQMLDDQQMDLDEPEPSADWASEISFDEEIPLVDDEALGWLEQVPMDGLDAGLFDEPAAEGGEETTTVEETAVSPDSNASIAAETDWFVDPGEETDSAIVGILGQDDEDADLADWLKADIVDLDADDSPDTAEKISTGFTDMFADLGADEANEETDSADETAGTGFTDMFGELETKEAGDDADSEDEAVETSLTDLFAELETEEAGDDADMTEEVVGTGFTDMFADLDDETAIDGEEFIEEIESSDGLSDFLSGLTIDEPETAVDDDKLAALADSSEPDEDYHTGYTQLFDELSVESFPEDDSILETDAEPDESMPDWLSETAGSDSKPAAEEASEPADDWLTDLSAELDAKEEPDITSEFKAADEPFPEEAWPLDLEDAKSAAPDDSEELAADEDAAIPTWMLGGDRGGQEFITPPPLEMTDSATLNTDELRQIDDLAEGADIPTWLLGDDQSLEETDQLKAQEARSESVAPAPGDEPSGDEPSGDEPSGDESSGDESSDLSLADWLLDEEPDAPAASAAEPEPPLDDLASLMANDEESLDWLTEETPVGLDKLEDVVIGDNDEREISPQDEPEKTSSDVADDMDWLDQLAAPQSDSQDEAPPEVSDDASYAARIAAGEGAAIDEPPTQASLTDNDPFETDDAVDLDWLEQLSAPDDVPTDDQVTLDWESEEEDIGDVLAGVTGELKADMDWLDTLAEESETPMALGEEPPDALGEDLGWLDDLTTDGDADDLDADIEPALALPELDDALAELPDETGSDLDWLMEIEAEEATESAIESATESATEVETETALEEEAEAPEDLDDAMAWLEELAAKQGAPLEELPSLSDDVDDAVDDATAVTELDLGPEMATGELDAAEAWLDELGIETETEAEAETEAGTTLEEEAEAPEDLDDAMAWLEELAAKQGAPLEELPSIANDLVDDTPEVAPTAILSESEEAQEPAPVAQSTETSELADALDWLEKLALEDGVSLEQTTPMAPSTAVSASENELEEALNWLEEVAQTDESDKTAVTPTATVPELESEGELFDLAEEMPEDPDEALAWLEQMAPHAEDDEPAGEPIVEDKPAIAEEPDEVTVVETETAVEEPTAAEETTAAGETTAESPLQDKEVDALLEMPDDPDAAMAWLEQLAARQGAPLEELPSITDAPELETPAVAEIEDEAPDSLADALDEASEAAGEDMAWLDDLAAEQDISLDELDIDDITFTDAAEPEAPEPTQPEAIEAEAAEPVAELEEPLADLDVPEDMDDAMAWLEELAAQQGAALEELPTLSGKDEGSLEDETAVAPPSDPIIEETEPIPPTPALAPPTKSSDDAFIGFNDAEDAAEWLALDEDDEPGQTAWLDSLTEPDVTGWLEAEEEATVSSAYDRSIVTRFDPQPDIAFDTGPLPPDADLRLDTGPLELPEEDIATTMLEIDEERLEQAREALTQNDYDTALQTYQTLVEDGGGMMTLIADLETAAINHPQQPTLRHLLGDAYMRNGQLQKALDTYRLALDQI